MPPGRGGRGGRGGGRGGGGGGAPTGPVARDDDGNEILVKHDGPSPLYPVRERPNRRAVFLLVRASDGGSIRLDQLAQLELAAEEGEEGKRGNVVGDDEDAPIDDPAMLDDDDEEDMERDDYYQVIAVVGAVVAVVGAEVGDDEDAPIEDVTMLDEDEEEIERDDYCQGQDFDDDEGYDEYDEGGGDDATY
eukprot:gene31354-6510_t